MSLFSKYHKIKHAITSKQVDLREEHEFRCNGLDQTHIETKCDIDPLCIERLRFPYIRYLLRFLKYGEIILSDEWVFQRWMMAKGSEGNVGGVSEAESDSDTLSCYWLFSDLAFSWTIALRFICWCCIIIIALLIWIAVA